MDTDFLSTVLPRSDDWFQLMWLTAKGEGPPTHHSLKVSDAPSKWEHQCKRLEAKPTKNGILYTPFTFSVDKITPEEAGVNANGQPKSRSPRKWDKYKVGCRILWLDVDVKAGGHYLTDKDAMTAVLSKCGTDDMPYPTLIVSTGGGFHFYWVLAEMLGLEPWLRAAGKFDQYWTDADVKFDPITRDSARGLRVPGTMNYKYDPPRPCRLLPQEKRHALPMATIERWPESRLRAAEVVPDIHGLFQAGADTDLGAPKDHGTRYTAEAIKECGVLSGIAADGGAQCSEPLWHNVLQFNRHTQDGESYNVIMSDKHTDYTPEGLAQKVALLDPSVKPIACETFRRSYMTDYGVDPCAQCKHQANVKIVSPLAVARKPEEVRAAVLAYQGSMLLPKQLIPYPGQYYTTRVVPSAKQNEPDKEITAFGVELMEVALTDKVHEEGKWIGMLTITYNHATRGVCTSVVPTSQLKSRECFDALNEAGLAPTSEADAQAAGRILMNWASKLTQLGHADTTYSRQGWQGEGTDTFVVGDQILQAGKPHTTIPAPGPETPPIRGTLPDWQGMANALLAADNPAFRITLAASFGTPLGRICKSPDGMAALSLYSSDSGVGKSTAVKVAATIWGSVNDMASGNDTTNGAQAAAAVRPHTPFIWDDPKTESVRKGLVDLLFSVVHGRGKQRATNTGAAAAVREHENLMIVTSNSPFHGELSGREGEGEAARLLEMQVPTTAKGSSEPFQRIKEISGVAGVAFMEKVMTNQDQVRQLYAQVAAAIDTKLESPEVEDNRERFYKRTATLAVTGAVLAKEWDITDMDPAAVLNDYVTLIVRLRAGVMSRKQAGSIEQLVEDFLVSDRVYGGVVDVFKRSGHSRDPEVLMAPAVSNLGEGWHYVVAAETCEVRILKAKWEEWYNSGGRRGTWNEQDMLERAVAQDVLAKTHSKIKPTATKVTLTVGKMEHPNGKRLRGYTFTFSGLANYDTRDAKDKLHIVTTPSDASSSEPLP